MIQEILTEIQVDILKIALKCNVDIEVLYPKMYNKLYCYYVNYGDMPYNIAKARTGDPYDWIVERLWKELRL